MQTKRGGRYKFLFLLGCVIMAGCATHSPPVSPSPERGERAECYQKYQIALNECAHFLREESDLAIKDQQTIKCLSNKDFSKGIESCNF